MAYTAAVITVSDLGSRGQRVDTSGPAICAMLEKAGFTVTYTAIVPEEIPKSKPSSPLRPMGVTSISSSPPAALGFLRGMSPPKPPWPSWTAKFGPFRWPCGWRALKLPPRAMLSRAVAGTRGRSLILNLPGSEKAARENLSAVIGALEHAMHMIAAEGH